MVTSDRDDRTQAGHAERLSDGRLDPDVLATQADEELIAALAEAPASGRGRCRHAHHSRWAGDLALRKAARSVYGLDHLPTEDEVLAVAEKWRPYRSLPTAYLIFDAFGEAQELAGRAESPGAGAVGRPVQEEVS
jgi:DNA-3-methyladenine glycosylase II